MPSLNHRDLTLNPKPGSLGLGLGLYKAQGSHVWIRLSDLKLFQSFKILFNLPAPLISDTPWKRLIETLLYIQCGTVGEFQRGCGL